MRSVPLSANASKSHAGTPARPSTPAKVYAPDAPRALYILGASPAELANLDANELVRIARREAA